MVDLSPDTSVYSALARPQGGFGTMSPEGLLGLVQRSRELQTQSAISDALRADPDNPVAAMKAAGNAGAFLRPRDYQEATAAESAGAHLHQWYMGEAGSAISSLLSKVDKNGNFNATLDDWHRLSPLLLAYHVPQEALDAVEHSASADGKLDKDGLLDVLALSSGGHGLPTTQVNVGGIARNVPNVQLQRQGGVAVPPTAPPPQQQPQQSPKSQYEDTATTAANEVLQQQPRYPAGTTESTNLNAHYKVGTDLYNAHTAEAGNYRANAKPFEEMISLMREGNDGTTGRGLDALNKVKNSLYSLGIFNQEDKAGIAKVSRFEQLKKYMVQAVQSGTLGTTDARMIEGIMGSPNVDLLTQSNMKLGQVMLGMMRRNSIAVSEFNRTGLGNLNPGLYGDWRANWEKRQDTAGFVWDQMTKDERAAYRKAHPGQENAIGSSWQAARRSGISPKLEGEQ